MQKQRERTERLLLRKLQTIVEKPGSLLMISELESDRVFAYAEESKLQKTKALLELIDNAYLAFREKALRLFKGSACPCRACQALPSLDLKFMVPRGDFIIQQVAGSRICLGQASTLFTGF